MRLAASAIAAVFGWALFAPLGCTTGDAASSTGTGHEYCSGLVPVAANPALSAVAAVTFFLLVFGLYTLLRRRGTLP